MLARKEVPILKIMRKYVCNPMWNMGPIVMDQPNVRLPPLVSLRKILV